MSLRLDRVALGGSELAQAYLEDYESVQAFYPAGSPADLGSYEKIARQIREHSPGARWDALQALAAAAPARLSKRVEALVNGRGLIVSTGQQAGLFLGPLYTLYKALTAVRLARQLEERLGLPVMALFSAASEDHDWAEVNHTYLVDTDNRLVRLALERPELEEPGAPSPPVERILVQQDIEKILDQLTQLTPNTEFKADVLKPLREAYRPGRSYARAFQDALAALLQSYPLLVVRSSDPIVKGASRELLWGEWEKRSESEERLTRRAAELERAGYAPQVPLVPGTTNLFLEGALGRDRMLAEAGRARLRRSAELLDGAELRELLQQTPVRLSAGVLLQPVADATAFPVVAYVGGPGEIAYLAQSQALFDLHSVPTPVVVPRVAFRLVEPKVARVLEKYGIEAEVLAGDSSAAINRLIRERAPRELQESIAELRRVVGRGLAEVERAAQRFDPGSRSAVGSGKQAVIHGIEALETKIQSRVKEKHRVMQQQLEKAAVNLYPNGGPQERVLNPYPFLVRYGLSLVDELHARASTPLD